LGDEEREREEKNIDIKKSKKSQKQKEENIQESGTRQVCFLLENDFDSKAISCISKVFTIHPFQKDKKYYTMHSRIPKHFTTAPSYHESITALHFTKF